MGALFSVCGSEKHLPPICDGAIARLWNVGARVRSFALRVRSDIPAEDLATPGPLRNAFQLFKSGRPVRERVRRRASQPGAAR